MKWKMEFIYFALTQIASTIQFSRAYNASCCSSRYIAFSSHFWRQGLGRLFREGSWWRAGAGDEDEEWGGKRVWLWRNPSIHCSYNLLVNSHTAPFTPHTAGSQTHLVAICSPWTSPQACTGTSCSASWCCRKQVKCIQHSREASHGFLIITFVKVPPWRRQTWRACSYERDSSWGLIPHR